MWFLISGDFQEETPSVVLRSPLRLGTELFPKNPGPQLRCEHVAGQRKDRSDCMPVVVVVDTQSAGRENCN